WPERPNSRHYRHSYRGQFGEENVFCKLCPGAIDGSVLAYRSHSLYFRQKRKKRREGHTMNSIAMIVLSASMGSVALATAYFFYKVLSAPSKPEPDSYADNDETPSE